ncbi:TraB/GumN family protein [Moritella sp. 24]|uniref:TraB/GumN family protein n=1 Tax=Moritella sp. 24 TaxID=2746230 RepID=UPI001BAA0E08|nr:TraB/GumN family protein [Moritella sp. 24]QUM76853.1 TraB/GumN family protein [Moritella sp. 24]
MKKFKLLYLIPILLFSVSHLANATSSVWKISNGKTNLYLGGTVHVLTADDYPLPPEFDRAYKLANTLVLETDMAKLESPEFQQTMLSQLSYPVGQDLTQNLTPETYQRLAEYCQSRGIGMQMINNFKPSMVSLMLTMVELQRLKLTGVGVDNYYNSKAMTDGKPLGKLETVEQQLAFIADMGKGKEDELIRYSLEDIKVLLAFMQQMKVAWRDGNAQALVDLAITPLIEDFPDIYQSLLVTRNNNWLPQIEMMFKNKETELILVGALHLVGKDGLLQRLEAQGYKVTQL